MRTTKTKGKRKKEKGKSPFPLLPFAFCLLPFAFLFIAALPGAGPARAEVSVWRVGEGGLSWYDQRSTKNPPAAVSFEHPEWIQPNGFVAGVNLTGDISFMDGQPEDFTVEGQAYVWDRAAIKASNLVMVDGEDTTSTGERFKKFGVDQKGRIFYFDLGASYPANRIVFYPSPEGKEDFLRAFQIRINDGRTFSKEGGPIYTVLRRVEINTEPIVDIEFPLQLLRFIELKTLVSNPFEIAEVEIYGLGFVPKASYQSKLVPFEPPVNFGELTLNVSTVGEGLSPEEGEVVAVVRVQTGTDDTPLVYHRLNLETREEEEVTEEVYEDLKFAIEKGPIRPDGAHWSPWSNPIRMETEGTFSYPLDFLPGPCRYFRFSVFFTGSSAAAVRLHSLSATYSSALAQSAFGKVALLSEPDPPGGVVTTPIGVETFFTYDVRAEFDAQSEGGFDGLRLETLVAPDSITLSMGDPLTEVQHDSVQIDSTGLMVYFPSHRVTRQNNPPIRVTFRAALLRYNTTFKGWLLDSGGNLPQPILRVSEKAWTGFFQVFGSLEAPLRDVEVLPNPITPNGDGRNDEAVISYDIFHLVEKAQVAIRLYDLSGARVREVFSGLRDPGNYDEDIWDGRDEEGQLLPPGTYICRVSLHTETEVFDQVKAITVVY
jgi:hypothetical protein